MYYKEKFENGKWWFTGHPEGEWVEFSDEAYKRKAIELSTKAVKENDFIGDVVKHRKQLEAFREWTRRFLDRRDMVTQYAIDSYLKSL